MSEYLMGFRASVLQYQDEKRWCEEQDKKKEEKKDEATPTLPD
jgi:hypothetical protein